MPFDAKVLQVLIASPGDLGDERAAIEAAVQQWNAENATETQVLLLPRRWETDAAAEQGAEAQSIINEQFADATDIVLGVFWTRLGTETKNAKSGTLEEIERAHKRKAGVSLFFCTRDYPQKLVDLDQLKLLRDAKTALRKEGLVAEFDSIGDLRDQVRRSLIKHIRKLVGKTTNAHVRTKPRAITEWEVVFCSDRPSRWRSTSSGIPDAVARFSDKHGAEKVYVRVKRRDTGDAVILRVPANKLRSLCDCGDYIWNGQASKESKKRPTGELAENRMLGIASRAFPTEYKDDLAMVAKEGDGRGVGFAGWGFARGCTVYSDQTYGWSGKQIEPTEFEIALSASISDDEKALLLK